MVLRLLDVYRRSGADLPFGDPARAHGSAMEGYYWRIVDAPGGSVIVLLCGVCQGPWATVAVASHPGGFVRHAVIAPAAGRHDRFGVRAAGTLHGSAEGVHARFGDDTWIDLRTRSPVLWPRPVFGALGPAQAVPGLGQYWHPVVLAAQVEGQACIGGLPVRLDGATAYAEKNWGPRFAGHWWCRRPPSPCASVPRSCGSRRRWRACASERPLAGDLDDQQGLTRFYMRVWLLFFLEYALMPAAVLAG